MEILILIVGIIGVFILATWKLIKIIKQELKIRYLKTDKYKCRKGIYLSTYNYDKNKTGSFNTFYLYHHDKPEISIENIFKYIVYNNCTPMGKSHINSALSCLSILGFNRREELRLLMEAIETFMITDKLDEYYIKKLIKFKNTTMKVYCFSYLEFNKLVTEFNWKRESLVDNNAAVISIVNPKTEDLQDWTTVHPISSSIDDLEKVLNISFRDDSEDFTIDQAKDIIKFIELNKGKDFYVHCIMGKSRSQAICRFILDNFEGYVEGRPYDNPIKTPNYHVLSTLNRVLKYTV